MPSLRNAVVAQGLREESCLGALLVAMTERKENMGKRVLWLVSFSENGEEYLGSLTVRAHRLRRMPNDPNAFVADGVWVRIDEHITSIEKVNV